LSGKFEDKFVRKKAFLVGEKIAKNCKIAKILTSL